MPANNQKLEGRRVAILATDGFEESELIDPKNALREAGATVEVISFKEGEIKGWSHGDWGQSAIVDLILDQANPEDYDAIMLPGGVINADHIRADKDAIAFIRHFAESGKPIAAICHAPWALIETGLVKGRTLTSWPSLKSDLMNAGAIWVDEEVVSENGMVTSRKPDDLPAFNAKMIEEFCEGKHTPRSRSNLKSTEGARQTL